MKRMTGFSPRVQAVIAERSGEVCEIQVDCGGAAAVQFHHRRPRGSGGSSLEWVNMPTNALHVCEACHRWVESNRAQARWMGWLVPLNGCAVAAGVRVKYRCESWVVLDDDGGVTPC